MMKDETKYLGFLLGSVSLFLEFMDGFWLKLFTRVQATPYFILTLDGIQQGFIWQLITYPFVYPSYGDVGFGYVINLFFNIALLWKGSELLIYCRGMRSYSRFVLFTILFVGVMTTLLFYMLALPLYMCGPSPILYALFIAIVCSMSTLRYNIQFLEFMRTKWMAIALVVGCLIFELLGGYYVHLWANVWAMVFAYFYAILVWRQHSPFTLLYRVEKLLFWIGQSLRIRGVNHKEKLLREEAFVDRCLLKVQKFGRESLYIWERGRLAWIAYKKRRRARVFRDRYKDYDNLR